MPGTDQHDERVLILAPIGRDGLVTAALLREHGLAAAVCADAADAGRQLAAGAGALLVTEEAFEQAGVAALFAQLHAQPPWSELPLIILTRGGESRLHQLLDLAVQAAGGVTLLERPLGTNTLLRTIEVALRSRRRQYQVRDLLQQRKEAEERLARDLDAMTRLRKLGTLLAVEGRLEPVLVEIVDAAIAIAGADFGNIQLLDPVSGELRIAAQRGFAGWWLDYWDSVGKGQGSCGTAFARGERIIVEDVEQSPIFAGTPALDIQLRSGVRAVQTTPLLGRSGKRIGMVSTHYRKPGRPDEHALRLLDLLARQAADVIERMHAEAALRQSEERFRTLADNISQLVWMADAQGGRVWYNRRWFDYTGTTLAEMQGWGWKKVHHPEHIERVVARVQHSWDTGEAWEDIFPLRGKDGEYRWFLTRALPIRDEAGTLVRWFGTNTDITAQRELEQQLRTADRRKDEFLATLAHELRNPLAPIRNAAQLLMRKGNPDRELKWCCEVIDRQVGHMVRLLDDLLDVSRISHGKLQLRKERVELSAVLQSALETSLPLIRTAGHELSVAQAPEAVYVDADPVRLAEVFANLLNNAAKYTEAGGHIGLTSKREGDEIVVSVKDDGIGIAPEILPRIFDMFAQAQPALARSQGGLGIGLSLVRGLVTLHGGRIEARSEGPGRGSEFIVRLPVSESVEPPLGSGAAAQAGAKNRAS